MRRRGAVIIVLLATLLSSARAEALDDSEQQARLYYAEGTRHFDAGEFSLAAIAFKRAYDLSPAPGLLFNIAQAYRAARDREHAIFYYEAYLREAPDGSERSFAEARLAELRVEPVQPPAPRDSGRGWRTAGALTAGGGLALVAVGLAFGLEAKSELSDGKPGDAGRAQTSAVVLTGVGVGALVAGGIMVYVGSTPVGVSAAAGGGGGQVAVSFGF